ncbi:MAG: acyl carrier protein [Clostridiales bacterium]|nr:acyl carrier protein [Clostridiales bacterium]
MIFEKVREIIADKLSLDEDEIKMESSFVDDLGADSLDLVELVMALEDEFDLEIPDEEVEKVTTVGDVVEYIKSHSDEN